MADNREYDDADYDEAQRKQDKTVRWSTVALSVGLSSLASAVIIGVGSAVMLANADTGQVNIISGEGTSGVTSKKDANTTTAQKATNSAKATSTASAGSSSGEPARINGGGVPAPVDTASGGSAAGGSQNAGSQSDSGDSAIPAQPSNAELKAQMDSILAAGATDDYIASNLENPAGVQTIRDAGEAMRAVPIFQYEMVDPVVVEGDKMTATIQMSMIGLGEKPPADLYYVAKNGKWVLTDESVCLIAQQARVTCTVG